MEKDQVDADKAKKKETETVKQKSVKLKANGNSLAGRKPLDNIEINPQLDSTKQVTEQSRGGVVLTFGRMNPPTVGHEKLVNKVKDVARSKNATPLVYLSHSQDKKKNPLEYEDKVRFAKAAFGKVVQHAPQKTLIDILKTLQTKFSEVTLVVGSDRVDEFETLLNKYNKKDYTFEKINVVSAGERDPDAQGVSGMSASKMRAAVQAGDQSKFVQGLPRRLHSIGKQVYELIHAGMEIHEQLEQEGLLAEFLDLQQRRKRALVMKRFAPRIKRARELAQRKIAGDTKLKKRAMIQARNIIRKRVAGRRGAEYASLTPGEKIQVDIAVEKRKKIIGKIAKRLLPKVKQAEFQRMRSFMQGQQMEPKHTGMVSVQKESMDELNTMFIQYAEAIETTSVEAILEEMTNLVLDKIITEKQITALEKRSNRSGIEYDLLEQVYVRGLIESMGDHQAAFNRVNAFCCGGKTAMDEDYDLYQLIEKPDLNDVFESNNKPYVKPHYGSPNPQKQTAWKASNKHGKVKYFGLDFKNSAHKHAGISESYLQERSAIAREPGEDAETKVGRKLAANRLMGALSDREKHVIKHRFTHGHTHAHIADKMGVTAGRVRQIEAKALWKMKSKARADNIDARSYVKENFLDGKGPGRPGDSARHGLKGKSAAELRKIRSSDSASPRKKQLAHFMLNMTKNESANLNEDLRKWFDQKWVRMNTKGEIKGDCAREEGEGKPKCLPQAKALAMDKDDRALAVRRKRREDPVADRQGKGGKPVNVATEAYITEKNSPTNPALWSRAKSLARQKFDVYPSAYANGWASKWYKSKGGGWKSVSEEVSIPDDLNNKLKKISKQLQKSVSAHGKQSEFIKSLISKNKKDVAESLNTPHVKPHFGNSNNPKKQTAWKASNKHGNVKYFGVDFKKSANKHAGVDEEISDPSHPRMAIDATPRTKEDRKKLTYVSRPTNSRRDGGMNIQRQSARVFGEEGNKQPNPRKRLIGTDELVKAYKADTPGYSLDESFEMATVAGIGITVTAAKIQGGFALHPSLIEDEDNTDENV